jgi:hypothetical protein
MKSLLHSAKKAKNDGLYLEGEKDTIMTLSIQFVITNPFTIGFDGNGTTNWKY